MPFSCVCSSFSPAPNKHPAKPNNTPLGKPNFGICSALCPPSIALAGCGCEIFQIFDPLEFSAFPASSSPYPPTPALLVENFW
ncbi:hypothetical protein SLEP1_g58121 [Rubroshorea leprosula]|uniref:Uncharacterized protein n=1 Tax=Rubroshorea leprosula TaxID=152421 RepID=A0AAV5MPK5_9ROSI|nr:hypothetical protein SLEP1_g58121 [Rubroshorea leprosula]